jgi:ATPase subunit of ABC transporter with duplicated ATPase domains
LTNTLQLQATAEEVIPVAFEPKENKIYEHSVYGQLKIPFTIKQDGGFKGVDKKMKLLGHSALSKFKDATFAKNKDEGTIDLNLNSYKLPVGEHVLFLRTQVKGKYSRVPKARIDAAKEAQKKADGVAAEADKAAKAVAAELAAVNKKKDATAEQKAAAKKKNDEAAAKKKSADVAKAAAAANTKKLTDAGKPKDITATFYSKPITVKVTPAPIELKPVAAGQVKQGEKVEFTVNFTRKYDFKDPVTIGVALPKGTSGLTVAKLTIAKDQTTGKFTITANDKASVGDLALNVEATMQLQKQTIKVTQPLKLKVIEVKKAAKK